MSSFVCLQLLHIDVLKVVQVLHMGYTWEATSDAGDVRDGTGSLLCRSLASSTCWGAARSLSGYPPTLAPQPGRSGASKSVYYTSNIETFLLY